MALQVVQLRSGGRWYVVDHDTRTREGPYKTREEAEEVFALLDNIRTRAAPAVARMREQDAAYEAERAPLLERLRRLGGQGLAHHSNDEVRRMIREREGTKALREKYGAKAAATDPKKAYRERLEAAGFSVASVRLVRGVPRAFLVSCPPRGPGGKRNWAVAASPAGDTESEMYDESGKLVAHWRA